MEFYCIDMELHMVYMLDKTQGKNVDKIHVRNDGIRVRVRVHVRVV
jgi:hypothetical protein